MKSIRARIILVTTGIALYLVLFLWLFDALYFHRSPGELTEDPISFWGVAVVLLSLVAIGLYFMARPISRAAKALNAGQELSVDELAATRKALRGLPGFILAFEAVAFFIGPIFSNILGASESARPLDLVGLGFTMIFSAGFGLMGALQTIYLLNIVLQDFRARLKIYRFDEGTKINLLRRKWSSVSIANAVFAAGAGIGAMYGYLRFPDVDHKTPSLALEMGVLLVFILIVVWITNRAAAIDQQRRLGRLIDALGDLSVGSTGNLTRIDIISPDEIGLLTQTINGYMDRQEAAVRGLTKTAAELLESSRVLEDSIREARSVMEATATALQQVKRHSVIQDEAIANVEQVLRTLVDSIDTVGQQVDTQASYVEQSSSAISEMTANIGSVSQTTKRAEELSAALDQAASAGGQAVRDSLQSIRDIEAAANEVASIINEISQISAQTNLLAMNAAIEAAHAGDMGRGFAVVADEVRKLANDSASSAKAISEKIKAMVTRVAAGVNEAGKAYENFTRVAENVSATREYSLTISGAMEEQKIGADEILSSVNAMVQATSTISQGTQNQRNQSKIIRDRMAELHRAFAEIQDAVRNQEEQTTVLVRTIDKLQTISQHSRQVSDRLAHILDA